MWPDFIELFSLGGGRGKPWVRTLNFILPSCVKPIKIPAHLLFILYPIGYMTVFHRISSFFFLHWTCASLNILVMFLPDVNLVLIFILSLSDPFPWSLTIITSIDKMGFSCLFTHHM